MKFRIVRTRLRLYAREDIVDVADREAARQAAFALVDRDQDDEAGWQDNGWLDSPRRDEIDLIEPLEEKA